MFVILIRDYHDIIYEEEFYSPELSRTNLFCSSMGQMADPEKGVRDVSLPTSQFQQYF